MKEDEELRRGRGRWRGGRDRGTEGQSQGVTESWCSSELEEHGVLKVLVLMLVLVRIRGAQRFQVMVLVLVLVLALVRIRGAQRPQSH